MEIIKEDIWPLEGDIRNAIQYYGMYDMLIGCTWARKFLDMLPYGDYIVDTKLVMLKPGWYPCIPGWHCDEVMRDENNNLDWLNTSLIKGHYMALLDFGTGSLTEFCEVSDISEVKNYTELNKRIEKENPEIKTIPNNAIVKFNVWDAHRGVAATGDGWRYFIRATRFSQRDYANELRTQNQVYIPAINVGW